MRDRRLLSVAALQGDSGISRRRVAQRSRSHSSGAFIPRTAREWRKPRDRYNADPTKDRFLDELRLKHRDGTYRWVVSRGRIVRNDQGAAHSHRRRHRRHDGPPGVGGQAGRQRKTAARYYRLPVRICRTVHAGRQTDRVQPRRRGSRRASSSEDVLGKPFWETGAGDTSPSEQSSGAGNDDARGCRAKWCVSRPGSRCKASSR